MSDQELSLRFGELSRRLAALERKVDFMLTALKLDYQEPPEPLYMAQIRALVAQRKVVDAIKVYRENTGASLVDAKNFVENMYLYRPLPQRESVTVQAIGADANSTAANQHDQMTPEQQRRVTTLVKMEATPGLLGGKVVAVEGVVQKTLRQTFGRGASIHYYYKLGNQTWLVTPEAYRALVEGLAYRVYFLPRGKQLVGIEPI